jgi:hypothetical protein
MPANYTIESVYIGPFSSITEVNAASLYKPGELGVRVDTGDGRQFQQVQLDSGVLSAATKGQLVYWKDKANYIVTNNNLFANGGATTTTSQNFVAGVITPTNGVTAAYYTFIQQQGPCSFVKTGSITTAIGDQITATTTTGNAVNVAAGTAVTVIPIGVATEVSTGTSHGVDLSIVGIP